MKIKEIVSRFNVDKVEFIGFMRANNLPFSETLTGVVVEDNVVNGYIDLFMREKAQSELLMNQMSEQEKMENAIKRKAMAEMLITSGFNFDGYRITKYSGYISGDDAMTVNRGSSFTDGGVRDKLMESLSIIRRNALRELKEAAYDLGCNAVIGVDFDYITLDPQTANIAGGTTYQPYVFCVTANGNAVIVEKNEEDKQ